jgi:hypothetical protein
MTVQFGPPYLESPLKDGSPGWHRLPSTAWLGADILLTGVFAAQLTSGAHAIWSIGIGIGAFVATAVSSGTSILEISRYRRPVWSVINLLLSLVVNPYTTVGLLVALGVLDFG